MRRGTLSDLVNEKAALSPEMALGLEKAFQLNMEMLLRMQAWFDVPEMRKQAGKIRFRHMYLCENPGFFFGKINNRHSITSFPLISHLNSIKIY